MSDLSSPPRRPRVLVVDDEEGVRSFLRRLLAADGYDVELAQDGSSSLARIAASPPDVVLLDVNMPGPLDGLDVCRRLRDDARTRLTPVLIITAGHQRELRLQSIDAGADDFLTKPVDRDELRARVRSSIRLKQYTDDLDSAASILMTLASMIEARDGHSEGHCYRMANYATRLGRALALGDDDLQALYRGGFLHDIGMLAIPDAIVRKTGPLSADEYDLVKSHTTIGDELCGHLRSLHVVRPIVRHHHERLDGSGYPDGLSGDSVPLLAQIVGVVDAYEAITTASPYQTARSSDQAFDALRAQVDHGWRRADLVERFVALVAAGPREDALSGVSRQP
jgi:putative two-component system response regulator